MAKFDYNEDAQDALELITESGLACEFLRDESVPNPSPNLPPPAPVTVSYPCFAVKVSAGKNDVSFLPEGTSISTTAKILIDAVTFTETPTIADKVKHNGTDYQIISVKPLSPADVDVMWTVYVNV